MNRREFSSLMAGAAATALLRRAAIAQQSGGESPVSPAASELYKRALVLDCNAAPAGANGELPIAQSALDINRNCGVSVIKLSIGGINADLASTVEEIAYIQRIIEVHLRTSCRCGSRRTWRKQNAKGSWASFVPSRAPICSRERSNALKYFAISACE